ncbi:class I SAM-dependent methyltransferase [Halobiforma nitratireducens]|uniref:Methyltransferase domain-containing protein n=1 Tax=Halobiforma nitratireducens JCM 10879 TaxID=1227454 RepID=M0M567_9EURY|nr:class I SAM-dependent methyltransferase [Halobiforma nitratireducens]EMA39495.1 hypothetical protein C446_08611 [Halobiforma nitratireducens JCM 10879]
MERVPLEELPTHSAWAKYLLKRNPDRDPPEQPTAYTGTETYEGLYTGLREWYHDDSTPASTTELVERIRGPDSERTPVSVEETLFLFDATEIVKREYDIVQTALDPVLGGTETVLDLGCGWGWTLDAIAAAFPDVCVVGGEYVPAGVEFAREAFAADRDRIDVDEFDFFGDWELVTETNGECIVFTKGALVTLPETQSVVDRLTTLAGDGHVTAGVHLEQVGPHPETVLGNLRRRYSRERGYSDSILEQLREAPALNVVDVTYDIFGSNPLHPLTRIRWEAI